MYMRTRTRVHYQAAVYCPDSGCQIISGNYQLLYVVPSFVAAISEVWQHLKINVQSTECRIFAHSVFGSRELLKSVKTQVSNWAEVSIFYASVSRFNLGLSLYKAPVDWIHCEPVSSIVICRLNVSLCPYVQLMTGSELNWLVQA